MDAPERDFTAARELAFAEYRFAVGQYVKANAEWRRYKIIAEEEHRKYKQWETTAETWKTVLCDSYGYTVEDIEKVEANSD